MPPVASSAALSLSLIAKCSFIALSRGIGFALFGFVLNCVLLFAAWPEIGSAIDIGHAAHTGLGALLLLVRLLNPVVLLAFVLLLFPALYFVLGQKHGIHCAASYAFEQNREFFTRTVLEKFRTFVESRRVLTESPVGEQVPALMQTYLRKMDGLPKPVSRLAKWFMRKANVTRAATNIMNRPNGKQLNLGQFLSALADELSSDLTAQAMRPSLLWLWVLVGLNLTVFASLKSFF